jgi:hypothetical protein
MNLVSFAGSFGHWLGALQLDDSSAELLALLAGMLGGWRLTSWHDQLKARRARVRKPSELPRKPNIR